MVTPRPTIGNRRGDMGALRHRRSARGRASPPSRSGDSVAEWAEARLDDLERTTATDDRVLPASNPLRIKGAAREAHTVSKFPYSPPKSPRSRRRRLCRTTPHRYSDPDGYSGSWHALHRCSSTRDRQAGATTRALMTHDDWSDPGMATRYQRADDDFEREMVARMAERQASSSRRRRGGIAPWRNMFF